MKIYILMNILLLLGCDPRKDDAKPSSSTEETASDETVDEPAMVGGSYLTCSRLDNSEPASSSEEVGVGCRIVDNNGDNVRLSDRVNATVTVRDLDGAPIDGIHIEKSANPDAPWHWTFMLAANRLHDSTIEAELLDSSTQEKRQLNSKIELECVPWDLATTSPLGITADQTNNQSNTQQSNVTQVGGNNSSVVTSYNCQIGTNIDGSR